MDENNLLDRLGKIFNADKSRIQFNNKNSEDIVMKDLNRVLQ